MHEKILDDEKTEEHLSRLVEKITKEAEAKADEIRLEAKKDLEKFEKETANLEEKIQQNILDKETSRINHIMKRTESEYSQKARKIIIETKERLIDEVFEKIEKSLQNFNQKSEYREYIYNGLRAAKDLINTDKVKILINDDDEKIISDVATEIKKKHEIEFIIEKPGLDIIGGFILTDIEERVRINYSIEYLLKVRRETIRTKISEILFE